MNVSFSRIANTPLERFIVDDKLGIFINVLDLTCIVSNYNGNNVVDRRQSKVGYLTFD